MLLQVIKTVLKLLDNEDKKKIKLLITSLFLGGFLALLGLGAIIPFITTLLSPEKNWLSSTFPLQHPEKILFFSICIIIIVFWLKNFLSYYCLKAQTNILYGIAFKTSRKLFQHYMHASYLWHLDRSTPELVRNIIAEASLLSNGILGPLGTLATESVTSLFIFVVLLYIDFKFTLIVTGSLLFFMFLFMHLTRHKAHQYAEDRSRAWAAMTKDVMQGVGGIKETKIYDLTEHFIKNFNINTETAASSAVFSNLYSQNPRFILESATITTVMGSIAFLLLGSHSNQQIILLLSIFGVAAMQLLPSFNRLMTALTSIKYALPALLTLEEEFNTTTSTHSIDYSENLKNNTLTFHKGLCIENISFTYPDGKMALNDVSLTIKKGQSVAFVGHSGGGKTTLADIILGLLAFDSGKILIDEVELTQANLKAWNRHLGYIPQSIYLYDCSIRENIAFGVSLEKIDDQKVWQALEMASMKKFVETLPHNLNTLIGENGMRLSGGQRQRIGIARALYRNPDVLIMDEATAALDNQTEKEVTEAIQKAAKSRTVITIAHRLSTIKNSDTIFFMENGKIIASGSYEELLSHCEAFKHLVQIEIQNNKIPNL